jgi:hypothetical protein
VPLVEDGRLNAPRPVQVVTAITQESLRTANEKYPGPPAGFATLKHTRERSEHQIHWHMAARMEGAQGEQERPRGLQQQAQDGTEEALDG